MDRQEKADALIAKVREMRKFQKMFFNKDKSVLLVCKNLEKEVDTMIASYDSPQTSLLDGQ